MQRLFARVRQYGVLVPGGAEVLVHTRRTLEEVLSAGSHEPLAVLDLDLRNAFPSLEWDAIREVVCTHAPGCSRGRSGVMAAGPTSSCRAVSAALSTVVQSKGTP